jgi:hypothetical protein
VFTLVLLFQNFSLPLIYTPKHPLTRSRKNKKIFSAGTYPRKRGKSKNPEQSKKTRKMSQIVVHEVRSTRKSNPGGREEKEKEKP